jgi:hypothetical protein
MFSSNKDKTGFNPPTAEFFINPSSYTNLDVPGAGGVLLSGNITPNDGNITGWAILEGATTLSTGVILAPEYLLQNIPSTVGSYNYSLSVTYENNLGTKLSLVVPVTLSVTSVGYYGQLALPTDDIPIPIGVPLSAGVLATFTSSTQTVMMNLFSITAVNTGRIVLVVPYSYGQISDITDNTDNTVLSQFNFVDDPGVSRIYTTINTLTPGTYYYKLVF